MLHSSTRRGRAKGVPTDQGGLAQQGLGVSWAEVERSREKSLSEEWDDSGLRSFLEIFLIKKKSEVVLQIASRAQL